MTSLLFHDSPQLVTNFYSPITQLTNERQYKYCGQIKFSKDFSSKFVFLKVDSQ